MNTENNTNHALHGDSTNDKKYPYRVFHQSFLQVLGARIAQKVYEQEQNLTKQQQ